MLNSLFVRASDYSWSRVYCPNPKLNEFKVAKLAYFLFILNIVFMIRGFAISNLIEVVLFSLFIFNRVLRNEFMKALNDRAVLFLTLFYLWVCLSGVWSAADWDGIFENWLGWRKILLVPIGAVVLNSKEKAQLACYVLLAMGLVYLGVALVDLVGLGQIWWRPYHSVAQDANVQGLYFILAGSCFIITAWARRKSLAIALGFTFIGVLFYTLVVVFGISRSGYVAFLIAGTGLGIYLAGSRWAVGLVAGLVMATACMTFSSTAQNRVHQAISELAVGAEGGGGEHTSGSIRYVMWVNTIELIARRPIIGTGAGGFQLGYAGVVDEEGWRGTITDDPHNHYLHIFSQYGLIGFTLFFLYQITLGMRVLFGSHNACILGIALMSISVIGLFNGIFGAFAMGRLSLVSLTIFSVICFFDRQKLHSSTTK